MNRGYSSSPFWTRLGLPGRSGADGRQVEQQTQSENAAKQNDDDPERPMAAFHAYPLHRSLTFHFPAA